MFDSLSQRLRKVVSGLAGRGKLSESNMQEGLAEIRAALLEADVHFRVARELVERVEQAALGAKILESVSAGEQLVKIFHDELVALMQAPDDEPIAFAKGRPTVVLMAGLQGAGKTTTSAKLAAHLRKDRKRKPLLVAADVQRPAAVDQLQQLGKQIDIPVFHVAGEAPETLATLAVAEAKRTGRDTVIIDTAGRLHIDEALMAELARVKQSVAPDTTFLVCDAMTGQDAVRSAQAFVETLPLDGVILTKLDGDSRGGAALSVRHVTGAPVRYAGWGEKVEDLQPFHADRLVSRVLGMGDVVSLVEKAQAVVDEKEAEDQMKRMMEDRFTLEDFLSQLRAIKKMGNLKGLLEHLPGMPSGDALSAVDDKMLVHSEAVVLSMTPDERLRPEKVDAARKRRIARGCGLNVDVVSRLLKQFDQMRGMMKKMKKGGLFGRLKGMMGGGLGGAMSPENMPDMAAMGGAGGMPGLPPGFGGDGGAGRPGAKGDATARRKNRKAERQRKKKNRRRR